MRLAHRVWLGVAGAVVVVVGVVHAEATPPPPHAVTPVQVIAAPSAAPEAYLCAVRCPGYVAPADGPSTLVQAQAMADAQRTAAGYWTGHKGVGVVPPNGPVIVTRYAPVPAGGQQATAQPKASKATSTRAAPKAPKQTQPSTTVTTKQSTRTTAGGTVTVTNSTTTTTKGTP